MMLMFQMELFKHNTVDLLANILSADLRGTCPNTCSLDQSDIKQENQQNVVEGQLLSMWHMGHFLGDIYWKDQIGAGDAC